MVNEGSGNASGSCRDLLFFRAGFLGHPGADFGTMRTLGDAFWRLPRGTGWGKWGLGVPRRAGRWVGRVAWGTIRGVWGLEKTIGATRAQHLCFPTFEASWRP